MSYVRLLASAIHAHAQTKCFRHPTVLNEHAPYKRGVARPKWCSQKLFDMHKTWPSKHLTEERRKRGQNHAQSSSFWHKTVAIPSIYTKVDTVARASTCDSCFGRAIADTKRIDKYRLLLAEKTPQGAQTQLLASRNKRTSLSAVCVQRKCL